MKRRKTNDKYYKGNNQKNTLCYIVLSKLLSISYILISKIFSFIFSKIKTRYKKRKECKNNEKKVFSTRCNIISALVILLSVLFVYVEDSIFYAYPILTVVLPFMYFSEGVNLDIFDEYKDLKLYNAILKLNTFALGSIIIGLYEELWFLNILACNIFIIPYFIGNFNKKYDWDIENINKE